MRAYFNAAAILREREIYFRAAGALDLADTTRQIADAIERDGPAALSCCAPLRGSARELDREMGLS